MTLFGEIKSFLKDYFKNPIVLAAVAYLIYKIVKSHAQKKTESITCENLRVLKSGPEGDLVLDTETGKKFLAKGDSFTLIESNSERLERIQEAL